ncbi:MAG: DUF6454 family protein [Planctomycetota bacterium]
MNRSIALAAIFVGLTTTAHADLAPIPLEALELPRLEFGPVHTQGLFVRDGDIFVTARRDEVSPREPILLSTRVDAVKWQVRRLSISVRKGLDARDVPREFDHPGGFDTDGEHFWIPLSGSRRDAATYVQRIRVADLKQVSGSPVEPVAQFRVSDHIGAIAVRRERSELIGASWDTKTVYVWDYAGKETRRLDASAMQSWGIRTPTRGLAVQDWKWVDGRLYASGLLKGSQRIPGTRSRLRILALDAKDAPVFRASVTRPTAEGRPERGREGMAVTRHHVYFLPDDLRDGKNVLYRSGDPRLRWGDVLEAGSRVERVSTGSKFTEGPVTGSKGELYFSDQPNDRILRWTRKAGTEVFRSPCGTTNGMILDSKGRLICCQSSGEKGGRRVVRIESDGTETILAAMYGGKRFIAPNDLCIDSKNRVYFTDPYYGPPAVKSQPWSGVYRIDEPGKVEVVVKNLGRPNGILITPDDRTVYVSDRLSQKLHRYRVESDASLTPAGVVYDFSPDRGIDGMCIDVHGNIYAAAGQNATTGLFVLSPHGELLFHLPMPEFATNVTFGGSDRRSLFLTASTSVYHLRTLRSGLSWPAGQR